MYQYQKVYVTKLCGGCEDALVSEPEGQGNKRKGVVREYQDVFSLRTRLITTFEEVARY